MLQIDAHHHLWHYNATESDWLEGDLESLRRDFMPADLARECRAAGVSGTVAVQARQTIEETDWLLQLADTNPLILGVVGWLPLQDRDFPAILARYREQTPLKALRHVVQAEAPGFLDSEAFNTGVAGLQGTGLVYDLLIFEHQLQEATRFVDRHPNQVFVLDHIAKPRIAAGELQPWADNLRELARRDNVFCKVSGMVTEADPKQWTTSQLQPYFDIALETFTSVRLMAGTDWPVLCAGATYERWWQLLRAWTSALTTSEQAALLGGTAVVAYGLNASTLESIQEIST